MNDLKNTKLISLLSVLNTSEWRLLGQFIESGVGGPVGKSSELVSYLSEFYPEFNAGSMNKRSAFKAIFNHERYEDKKLRYAMTDLYRQAHSFLAFTALQNDAPLHKILAQESLAVRGADKAYLSSYHNDEITSTSDAGKNAEFFFQRYRETYVHINHYLTRLKRTGESPMGAMDRSLDLFYIAKKLQLLCEMINAGNVISVNHDFFLQDELIKILKQNAFADVPVIHIYYRILMTLTEPEVLEHFEELRNLLNIKGHDFERGEVRDMYQYLMNYCIKKINQGNTNFVDTLFEIYKLVLERKFIFSDNSLSQWDYKNIVVIGIRASQQEWVSEFIESHKEFLPESERNNAYVYNRAYHQFSVGEFRKALSLLQQVEFTDLYYQLDMRAILLKCYFEMDEEEALLYHLSAFSIFLRRNKMVSDYQRTIYLNLIKYTRKLIRLNGKKSHMEKLLSEIDEVKQIADVGWLRRKVEANE